MNIDKSEAKEHIRKELESKNDAVSYDAIERNASNIEFTTSNIEFSVRGTRTSPRTTILNKELHLCPFCNDDPDRPVTSMSESFQRSPFKSSPEFYVPIPDTHTKVECEKCGGVGDVACSQCNGTGLEECFDCSGKGYQEIQEPCDTCGDESSSTNCQICGGSGQIEYRESCSRCDGTGSEACFECNGDGREPCLNCEETGFRHEYEAEVSRINRVIRENGLPEVWSDAHKRVAANLKLPHQEFTADSNSYQLSSKNVKALFFSFNYGDNRHHAVIAKNNSDYTVYWHPSNGYPETSYRRKLADIKSRLLW